MVSHAGYYQAVDIYQRGFPVRLPALLHCLVCCLLLLSVAGCSLFRSVQEADDVRVVHTADVQDCTEIATTEVSLTPGTMESHRSDEDVAGALETLAREAAAQIGGNTAVARSEIDNRSQLFTVYRCTESARR